MTFSIANLAARMKLRLASGKAPAGQLLRWRRWLCLAVFLTVASGGASLGVQEVQDTWKGVERIVAIGDVHGDYSRFVTLLRLTGLIDEKEDWTGGRTHLMQTGDLPDRGPDSRKVMDLLMKLEVQAKMAGGYVHALIGNHEAMNIYGDTRYVDAGECASFIDEGSASVQKSGYMRHVVDLYRNPPPFPEDLPRFDEAYRAKWEKENPLGHFEHREAIGPKGKYGKWILGHNAVVKIDDTLFVHGGIGPKYASLNIRQINKRVRRELENFGRLRGGIVIDKEGPLWYRGLANNSEDAEAPYLEALLKKHGVKRIVMGHTTTRGVVMTRFGGRAMFVDVGISETYGGRLGALVIEHGEVYAIYEDEKLKLLTGSQVDD